MNTVRIATRNSPLALWQAHYVKDLLQEHHSHIKFEIVGMTTRGDQLLDRSLSKVGGKGLFLKELESSLISKKTDIAVHSMKDVPVTMPDGLEIPVLCERHDPRDAFVSNKYQNLYALPQGAKVGTSSLRRVSQLKYAFPKLDFVELRGNVNTRLAKLDDNEYDAIILAAAGLIRLELEHRIKQYISPKLCLPAVGQGIVGIQCRSDDGFVQHLLKPLNNRESTLCLAAERAMNAVLEGGCQVPIAGYAKIEKGRINMRGLVGAIDGSSILQAEQNSDNFSRKSAVSLGESIAHDLLGQGAKDLLDEINELAEEDEKPVVLLTREPRYLGNMKPILERLDFVPIEFKTLEAIENKDSSLEQKLGDLSSYTDLLFVSRNAVEYGIRFIQSERAIPDGLRVMAVGSETAKQLFKFGIDALFPHQGTGAEALLAVRQLKDMTDCKVLIVRGTEGLDWPAEEMRKRGAVVESAEVYQQRVPDNGKQELRAILKDNPKIAGVFLHSAYSAKNFMQFARYDLAKLSNTLLIVGSERIAEVARTEGWRHEIKVAESPSNKHMMIAFSENKSSLAV